MLYKPDFKFGGPIETRLFYNREKEVKFLRSKLIQLSKGIRHNYALVGPRRIGKSSILVLLENEVKRKNLIPVFIDCEILSVNEDKGICTLKDLAGNKKVMTRDGKKVLAVKLTDIQEP